MKLYTVKNNIGTYWVIADHPTAAQDKVEKTLKEANYRGSDDRKMQVIALIAEGYDDIRFITGKFLLT